MGAHEFKALRARLRVSQPVFAMHLHTNASTVRKWGQGATEPTCPALKLVNILANKGLSALD